MANEEWTERDDAADRHDGRGFEPPTPREGLENGVRRVNRAGEEEDPYHLEPIEGRAEGRPPEDGAKGSQPRPEQPTSPAEADEDWDPFLLEDEEVTRCPNCDAPMPGAEEVVCLRCGFDLSANKPIETATGVVEAGPEEEAVESEGEGEAELAAAPISPPGRGGIPLPAAIAGVAVLLLTIAYLAGADGLYPTLDGLHLRGNADAPPDPETDFALSHPGFLRSVGSLFAFYLFTLVFAGSTYGALYIVGKVERRPVGDATLALTRCLAIAGAAQLVRLVGLDYGWLFVEWLFQFILMGAIFLALCRVFFSVPLRDAGILGGTTLLVLALLFGTAELLSALL